MQQCAWQRRLGLQAGGLGLYPALAHAEAACTPALAHAEAACGWTMLDAACTYEGPSEPRPNTLLLRGACMCGWKQQRQAGCRPLLPFLLPGAGCHLKWLTTAPLRLRFQAASVPSTRVVKATPVTRPLSSFSSLSHLRVQMLPREVHSSLTTLLYRVSLTASPSALAASTMSLRRSCSFSLSSSMTTFLHVGVGVGCGWDGLGGVRVCVQEVVVVVVCVWVGWWG